MARERQRGRGRGGERGGEREREKGDRLDKTIELRWSAVKVY